MVETGRAFVTQLKEHIKGDEEVNKRYARASRKDSVKEVRKSSVTDHTDHIAEQNNVIDWEGAKVIEKDEMDQRSDLDRKSGPNVLNNSQLAKLKTKFSHATSMKFIG